MTMMTIDTKAMKKTEGDDEDDDDATLHGFSPACRVPRGSSMLFTISVRIGTAYHNWGGNHTDFRALLSFWRLWTRKKFLKRKCLIIGCRSFLFFCS